MNRARNVRTESRGSRSRVRTASLAAATLLALLAPVLGGAQPAAAARQAGDIGYEDGNFVEVGNPTESKPESKVWYQDGSWWSVQIAQDGVDSQNRPLGSSYIFKLNAATDTWTKTVKIENRGTAKTDVVVNGNTLYISSHKTDRATGVVETVENNKTKLFKFTYDSGTDAYTAVVGYPKVMNPFEMESLTIDRSSSGALWAGWVMGEGSPDPAPPAAPLPRKVFTQYSTDDGATWSTPVQLAGAVTTSDDIASIVAFGTKVGVMWSDQEPTPASDGFFFSVHDADPAVGVWGAIETAYAGANVGDDHLNLKSYNGRVFAAVKTSTDTATSPLVVLLQRSTTGNWTRRIGWVGRTNVTRPIVQINSQTNTVRLFATGPLVLGENGEQGGAIFTKSLPLDTGGFNSTVLGDAVMLRNGARINDASGSKAPVTTATGLVVLASEKTTKNYWHSRIPGGPPPGPTGTEYVAINPCRVVDTRSATTTPKALAAGEQRTFQVSGSGANFAAQGGRANGCAIPAGATAVEASVTAVSPGGKGFFRAWPSGQTAPNATFLNFVRGQGITNTGAISLGTGPKDLTTKNFSAAAVHYVIDVQGYFVAPGTPQAKVYVAITPCRVVDTRSAAAGNNPLAPNQQRTFQVAGTGALFAFQGGKANGCGVPAGARAAELAVTAVAPSASGFFRAWPTDEAQPTATFLNFAKNQNITNTGAISLGTSLQDLSVKNFTGTTHYVIDVQGYFVDANAVPSGKQGTRYVPANPCRVVDTRNTTPSPNDMAAGEQRTFQVSGSGANFAAQGGQADGCGIPAGAKAAEASITAVSPAGNGFFRAWPTGAAEPTATVLNFTTGRDITNTGAVSLGTGPKDLTTKNYTSPSHYVIDVQGYFVAVS